jgi:pilus assembly protein CpaB
VDRLNHPAASGAGKLLRRTQSNVGEIERDEPAPAAAEVERISMPKPDRRKGERRGMEALRAEALQAVISRVEDKNFGGLRNQLHWSRNLHPTRIILLAVALLAGGLAAFLVLQREPPASVAVEVAAQPAPAPTAMTMVARQAIGIGQRLTPELVEWRGWPEGEVRPEYVTNAATPDAIASMTGAVARFEFFPGEPIRQQKLVQTDQGYLSAVLGSGMRGVSVPVVAEAASGGFIVPNDHVDVVLTRASDLGDQVSQTILRNVRVLAIDTRLGETGTTGAPADPNNPRAEIFADHAIATLELDPAQAEVIINATAAGKLSLVLRSIVDFSAVEKVDPNQAIRMTSPFWTK